MADTPTVVYAPDGTLSVPNTFTVAPTQLLDLALAQATFDGSGAGGDYVPCLSIYAQSGQLLMRATSSTVTQGDNAEVSWFPFAESAAAGAASSSVCEWCYATRFSNFTVTTGAPTQRLPWTAFHTSNSSVFSLVTVNNTNDSVACAAPGVYLAMGQSEWSSSGTYPHGTHIGSDMAAIGPFANTMNSDLATANNGSGHTIDPFDLNILVTLGVPENIYLFVNNWDVSNHNVTAGTLGIVYFANATLFT